MYDLLPHFSDLQECLRDNPFNQDVEIARGASTFLKNCDWLSPFGQEKRGNYCNSEAVTVVFSLTSTGMLKPREAGA